MSVELQTFPEIPAHTITSELDGDLYRIRFVWRRRPRSWYLSLLAANGDPISRGNRLSPEFDPLFGIVESPPGVILVRGPSPYERADLGNDLKVLYVPESELSIVEEEPTKVKLK